MTNLLFVVPIEWLTFWLNMPFMLLLNDIRQGAFYAMLLSFWIIFTGEHIMVNIHFNFLFILTIQHYVIKFVSIFLRVLSSTNKTVRHDITEYC